MNATTHFADQARFWDRMAHRYAKKPVPDVQVYEDKLHRTDALLEPHHRLLEVGCGTGTTAVHHAPHVAHVRGVDLSPRMIEIARARADEAGLRNVDFQVGDVDRLPSGPRYDLVLAHSLLHLVRDPRAALVALHDALRPGGYLVATVPCLGDYARWFRFVGPVGAALGLVPRVQVFRQQDLMAWLPEARLQLHDHWEPAPRRGVFLIAQRLAAPEDDPSLE